MQLTFWFAAFIGLSWSEFNQRKLRTIDARTRSIRSCLLEDQLYHEDGAGCEEPFTQGPCDDGEWLDLDTNSPGVVRCHSKPEKLANCYQPVIGATGGVECQLRDGPSFRPCDGGVMMPDNFLPDTKPCPHQFSCQPQNSVYWTSIKDISQNKVVDLSHIQHLRYLVCGLESKHICLPDNNRDNLLTVENIVQSFKSPRESCQRNPCSAGAWPWLDEEGVYRCLPHSLTLAPCSSVMLDDDGVIKCDHFSLRAITPLQRNKCRKRRVFLWGKCVPRWG